MGGGGVCVDQIEPRGGGGNELLLGAAPQGDISSGVVSSGARFIGGTFHRGGMLHRGDAPLGGRSTGGTLHWGTLHRGDAPPGGRSTGGGGAPPGGRSTAGTLHRGDAPPGGLITDYLFTLVDVSASIETRCFQLCGLLQICLEENKALLE